MPTLNEQIRETIQQFRDGLPVEMSALIEQGAGEISALDIIEKALRPGDAAPQFELPAYGGGQKTLAEYLKDGPLVVTFYRGVWCPYCNLQLKEYSDRLSEITDLGASLVAITPEKPGALDILKASSAPEDVINGAVTHVEFDILFDAESRVAEQFGLVFELPESHKSLLGQIGVELDALTGGSNYTFPDPATYIIDQSGKVSWAFVPNNYRKRAEVDQIKEALKNASVQ